MSITKKIVLTLFCILSIVLGTGYFLGLAYFQTHFKIGTTINGFHCSFNSIDEAETLLSREVESYAIAVNTRNNGVEKIAANDVGLTFVGRSALVDIINKQDYKLWFIPEMEEQHLSADCYNIDETEMSAEMAKLKCMNNMVKGESAHIVDTNDFYQVSPAVRGTDLDKTKARQVVETAIRQWKPEVNLEDSGCYIDADEISEEELQQECDLLNSIQDTIITYDFGDRKETVDFKTVKEKFLDENYMFSTEKVKKYIKKIAKKYDTVGAERTFMTFDDRPAIISGGDYGWKTDIEKTTAELLEYIKENTIDVIKPVYTQTAVNRSKNDIGYSYLEIDTSNKKAVLYVDGAPVVQTDIKLNGGIESGFYKMKNKYGITDDGLVNAISFGSALLYQDDSNNDRTSGFTGDDDISGFSESTIHEGCATINATDMETIFTTMQEDWPVIVYNKNNIS